MNLRKTIAIATTGLMIGSSACAPADRPAQDTLPEEPRLADIYNFCGYESPIPPFRIGETLSLDLQLDNGILPVVFALAPEGLYIDGELEIPMNIINYELSRLGPNEIFTFTFTGVQNSNIALTIGVCRTGPGELLASAFAQNIEGNPSEGQRTLDSKWVQTAITTREL